MRLSKFTIGVGLYLIISASFAQQLWKFLIKIIGQNNSSTVLILSFGLPAILSLGYIIRFHFSKMRIIFNLAIWILAFIFSWSQPYFVEKLHVLEYGFLGWLAVRDLTKNKISLKPVFLASLFILLIGGADELFQRFLPYRVCDIRDVKTNFLSGVLGIILFLGR